MVSKCSTPFKELRNLSLSLNVRIGLSDIDGGAWTDCSWQRGVWERWVERAGSNWNWTGNCEQILKEKKRSSVSPGFIAAYLRVIFRDWCIVMCTAGPGRLKSEEVTAQ